VIGFAFDVGERRELADQSGLPIMEQLDERAQRASLVSRMRGGTVARGSPKTPRKPRRERP
jgi:hypothetical protein